MSNGPRRQTLARSPAVAVPWRIASCLLGILGAIILAWHWLAKRDFLITDARYLQDGQIPDQVANVGITGDKITYIGPERVRARIVIPGKGLILTPGLIDANSSGWLRESAARLKLPESTSHEPFSRRSPDIALPSANSGLVRR